jgi:hypothetical protein
MRTVSLAILLGVSSFASQAYAKVPASAPKATTPQHFSFDDDVVESGLDQALDGPVGAALHRRPESLIRVRKDFVPEMLRSCEGV